MTVTRGRGAIIADLAGRPAPSYHHAPLSAFSALPPARAFIDGASVDAQSGETFDTYAPATGEVLAAVAACGPEDVDRAVGLIVREPVGVVAAVLPRNFPASMLAWKLGPALAATEVGRHFLRYSADSNLKRIVLEQYSELKTMWFALGTGPAA